MKNAYYKQSLALTFSLISLVVTASTTGQLTLTDSSGVVVPTYQNGESAYIQVVDSDGNADAAVAETLTVKITSESEDTGTPFSATDPVPGSSNVGDGALTVLKTSYDTQTEDWTILAVSANSFLVTGSVSGQQSQQYSIEAGVEYIPYVSDNNEVSFIIANGSVAYAVGDTFTFSTSAGTIVGETVTLTETDVDTGIFTSSITLNETETPNAADGILDVQSGDLITVFYDDASGDWGDAEQVRSTALYAATVIKGSTLLADTIWTEENSPYLVTGDVTVSVNTTLTIMPGVKVLFLANTDDTVGGQAPYDSELIIQGNLNVAGTEAKGVILTSSNRDPAIGDWGGIRVENATANLAYTKLEYSAYGIDLNEVSYGETFTLSNSTLSYNGIGIKVSAASFDGVFTISDNVISNNSGRAIDGNSNYAKWVLSNNTIKSNGSNGDYVLSFEYSYNLSFTNNEILDNAGGINIYAVQDDLIFTGNTLSNNKDNDMMMSGGLSISSWASEGDWMTDSIVIEDNIIDDNSQTGIYLSQSGNADPAINRNKVRNNSGHGIYVDSQNHNTQPSIHNNEITGNGLNGWGQAGLYVSGKAVPSIVGNTIDNNDSGIYVNYNDVNGNGDFELKDNLITNNQGYGISVNGYAKPVINDNDIYGNTGYALENHTSFTVDAKNNWWGVDDSAEINEGTNPQALSFIYDGNTASNAGKVNYAGWLNGSNQGGGTPVSNSTTGQLTLTDSSGIVVPTYQSGESAYIQVVDSDGNADPAVAETLTVKITSESEDTGTPFSATDPVPGSSNVGDGALTVLKTSYDTQTEDWTILAVSANSFLVTGSVSGQQSQQYSIEAGVEYIPYVSDNNEVSFIIANGSVAYAVGDTFTFSTSAGTIVGETVTLTETDVDTGIFTSSITLNETETPNAADGILDVQSGDLITVFYDDASGDWGDAEQVRSTALYAATVIKGSTLLADTIWTEENSPYLVTGDVTVSVNTTLTIMPGVKVLFLANTDDTVGGQAPYDSELIIQGNLNVAGTEAKGVILTSSNRDPAIGDWGGIRVENATANLAYTKLEYSAYGIDLNEVSYGETFTLSNSTLSYNGIGIKVSAASFDGVFTISDNVISNNSGRAIDGNSNYAKWVLSNNTIKSNGSNGDYVLSFEYSYNLSFTNNEILDNAGGINIYAVQDDLIFTGNTLSNNKDNDMMMSGGLSISSWASEGDWMTDSIVIEDNIIDDNSQTGIYLSQSGNADPAINRNKVRNNSGHGIYVDSQNHNTQPSIHNNEITGNGLNGWGQAGLYVSGKAVPSIVGNTIDNNDSGIYVNYNDVNGNGDFELKDNLITNNQGYGISVNGYAKPVINDNDIYGNTGYALENHTSFTVDAKNNWWGVDDSAEINEGTNPQALSFIYDGNTASNAGKVNYAGWLSFSIQDQTPPITNLSSVSVISSLSFEITLSCNDDIGGVSSGCSKTYYTIDGSEPTTNSVLYEGVITLNESAVVKFFSSDVAGHKEVAMSKRFYIGDIDAQNASRSGELSIGDQDVSQTFSAEITEPIILLGVPSYKDSGSGVAKVTHVTSTTVTASFKEWEYLDGKHDTESVPYVALTAGRYLLNNGDELEVGELSLSSTQQWQETTFESSFAALPSVILTSQSNETNKVFNLLTDNITSSGFSAKLAEQENNTVGEYAEKVGYLAYYKNELEPIEQSEPFVVSSNIEVSSDWSAVDSFAISLQEEASFDEELVHSSEFISMVNINGTILLQQVGELETDTSSLRRSIVDTDLDNIFDVLDTDDDNDGVLDVDDAFSTNASASVDTDLDGLPDSFHEGCDDACITGSGLTLDLDDDNDGYSDEDELANETDSLSADSLPTDTDGDFVSDLLDTDDDNDLVLDVDDAFPLDSTESVDTDGDDIGNNVDTDDDNDGILDENDSAPLDGSIGDDESPVFVELDDVTFEATGTTTDVELVVPEVTDNNLNAPTVMSDYSDALALGTHEVTWTATDFAGNVTTATQSVIIVDTTAAKFDELEIQTINAMGVLSDISDIINNVQAYDLVDGNINAVVIGDKIYPSGAHLVAVSATDSSGNIVEADVEVHINPLVELSQSRKVEPGATVLLPVTLSGNAAVYPVGVTYTLIQSGSIIETNELSIAENISGVITIEIPNDALNGEVYSIATTSASNAVLGFVTSTQLTVDEANFAPTLTLVTQQDDQNLSVVDTTNGVVTVTAIVNDINVNDTHDIVWSSLNDTLVDLNTDGVASTFEFSSEGLNTDTYELTVSVSESNTSELLSVSVDMDIVVDASLAALDENTDSDNDGISDADEGYSDSDNDGISDYLDTDDNPSRLPIDDSTASMQTVNGLSLSLGDVVTTSDGATAANATVDVNDIITDEHFNTLSSITNFNVSGLTEVGQSVPIVIPLASGNTIAEGSIYRKYSETKGWFDFVVDSENGVYSALADEDGNCPYPLSTQYQEGLAVGDNCIQLVIKDGGENDADGLANGMVKDPGVLTSEVINQAPVIVVNTNETSNEGSVVTFDASATTDAENDTLTYQWVQLTGATVELSGQNTATLSFTAPQVSNDEFLTFELTVNDGRDSTTTEVEVLVLQVNIAPTVSIDSHTSSFDEGATVSLTATGADEDDDALSYAWEQTSGPTVTLSGASSASVTFTAPAVSSDQSLEFKVTVSDGIDTESKTTTVTVKNVAPVTPTTPSKESGGGGGSMGWILVVMSFGLLRKRLIKVAA